MNSHVVPIRTYAAVCLALLFLTGLTFAVSYLDLGSWNIVAALAIAATKASLVVWFFMHLSHATTLNRLTAGAGLLWLAFMLTFTLADYLSRHWDPASRWI